MADCEKLWENVLNVVKSSTNEAIFQSFFSVVHPLLFDDDKFIIKVDSPLVADWIKQKYLSIMEDSLSDSVGTKIQLIIHCKGLQEEKNYTALKTKTPKKNNKINITNLNSNFSLVILLSVILIKWLMLPLMHVVRIPGILIILCLFMEELDLVKHILCRQ